MAIASTILDVIGARGRSVRNLSLTLSGSYTTGGDTLDLTAIGNPYWIAAAKAFSRLPDVVAIQNAPGGYKAEVIPGTALNNYLVKWYSGGETELAAGVYPAALSGATDIVAEVVSKTNV